MIYKFQIAACLFLFSMIPNLTLIARAGEPAPVGEIARFDPRMDALIAPDAKIYRLADGFGATEGPVWLASENSMLFSDIPNNVIYVT